MGDGREISRRRLLRTAGIGSFGVFIGGILIHNPTTLRYLGVWNEREQEERIEVRVMAGGETYVERLFEVAGNTHQQVPCEWPNLGGIYRYGPRLDDEDEWTEATITEGGDAYRRIWIMNRGDRTHDDVALEPSRGFSEPR